MMEMVRMQKILLSRVGEYSIRQATSDDIPAVIGVNIQTLPEHYSDYFYYEVLNEHPQTFLVAELKGDIVGYIMCRIELGLSLLKRFGIARKGHVISVAVLKSHRGKGLGSRMIEHVLEEMRKGSCRECYLEVRVSNLDAIALYNKLSFKTTGTLQGYYKDGEAAHTMAIQL
jgi:ribosomal-protein-alanine N-acetyltransferase